MKSVYEYTNYRLFLKDYYEDRKAAEGFTYRDFARLAGMNSTSWLLHLIKGTKNLSADSVLRVSKALKLGKAESEYFEMMVPFTQARTNGVKDHYYQRMLGLKRKLKIAKIGEEQYDYYTKWHHPVIRSLVSKVDFADGRGGHDFAKLGRCLLPPISAREAKKSVQLLERLGLIARGKGGKYTQSNAVVSTGDEVASLSVVNYHKQVSRLAEGAHDRSTKEERDISALTLGVGEEDFQRIKARIQAFRKEIMDLAMASSAPDRVYQLNFQLFPVGKAADK
ncbi:MAG TPA: TIGR02147 family protein [Fibrobacteria bacterium]|nr:TIGR02147 family protein [Fibrobacteria bacterium]